MNKLYFRWILRLVWMTGRSPRSWEMTGGAHLGQNWFSIYNIETEDKFTVGMNDDGSVWTERK